MMMMNMYMYMIIFLLISVMTLFFSLILIMKNMSFLLEWKLFSFNSMNFEMIFLFDWFSVMFISVVFLISSMVLLYSVSYMSMDLNLIRFTYLLILFVVSMIFMILSPNLMSILLGWDGLGLTSYCLVIYYQNNNSFNSGMVTVLCNRLGDVGLLMSIGLLMTYGSWNMFNHIYYCEVGTVLIIIIVALTKSAQIPFSSWLPMAMAAPTPISALVHSSTLVTAGVYLLIRYNYFLMNNELNLFLLIISSLTMLMSGLSANFENDLKKIIALSTLSQLGLMMSILSLGMIKMSYYHLIIHALFKSLLFLTAGVIIHSMKNNQDVRFMGCLTMIMPYIVMMFLCANLALCGFPFLAGFYSKDLIMEYYLMVNFSFIPMIFLLISTMFTVSYGIRLMFFVFNTYLMFNVINFFGEDLNMNLSMVLLYFMSIAAGSILSWVNFNMEDIIILPLSVKLLILDICLMGCFVGYFFYYYSLKNKMINLFSNSLWFMDKLIMNYKITSNLGMNLIYYTDKSWIEWILGWIIFYYYLLNFYVIKNYFKTIEIFNFLMFMFILMLIIL